MKRRNFIISSGGVLAAVGVVSKKQSQSSIALSSDSLNFPSEVDYGYRDDFEMFDTLNITIDELKIITSNIENPESTKIKLEVSTDEIDDKEEIDEDIISEVDKDLLIKESGSVDLASEADISVNLRDELEKDDFDTSEIDSDDNGTDSDDSTKTEVELIFTLINEDIETEASDSFELNIFEIDKIETELYRIVDSGEIPDENFTDGDELPTEAWRTIPDEWNDEPLTTDMSLID